MAKKATKKPAGSRRAKTAASKRAAISKRPAAERKSKPGQGNKHGATGKQSPESAADGLVGLLETPLVNDVLAAGAAAAIATFTHHSLSRKSDGSTTTALKEAATAAAAAMGARLATEFDEIVNSANEKAKGAKA